MNIEKISNITGGSGYFAIKGLKQKELISIMNIQKTKSVNYKAAFKYMSDDDSRFDLEADFIDFKIQASCILNGWVYLRSNYFDKELLINKINTLNTKNANYYYVDSCVDGCEWIISENGKTIRVFDYGMSKIHKNKGIPISGLEEKFILQIKSKSRQTEFIENVYTSIIESTGNHYENLKNYNDKLSNFIIGYITIKNEYKRFANKDI